MNEQTSKKIRKAIYNSPKFKEYEPETKRRLYRRTKKKYTKLPVGEKSKLMRSLG